jgi:UDP-3-O-[3-hydroxymyristoyl] glucosamine N-acyltransferase
MSIKKILRKFGVPEDAEGTCAIQDLRAHHVSYLANPKYLELMKKNAGAYVLVGSSDLDLTKQVPGNTYLAVENPTQSFIAIHNTFYKNYPSLSSGDNDPVVGSNCMIDPAARFGKKVILGDRVEIHPCVVVGSNVTIGDDTKVFANTTIYDRVRIGKRCIIDSNASIGGDGFRIVADSSGTVHRLVHIGGVLLGDDVEFGNSSCVDRGSFGDTILERNVKVDNMVHIGHNAHIKENTQLAASSCIGGSTVIGRNCWVGIGATLSNGLVIGDGASVLINAVVIRDVESGGRVGGFYALPNEAWRFITRDQMKRAGLPVRKRKKKTAGQGQ